jgi:hypothetical protein
MNAKLLITPFLLFYVNFSLSSCSDHHPHDGGHHHDAPHGGSLVELGEHGTGFNLEVVHDATSGNLGIYVLGGHATNPVRIEQATIDLTVTVGDEKQEVSLAAVANPAFDESVGDTSFFEAKAAITGTKEFEGTIKTVTIKGRTFDNVEFHFPEEDDHEQH